MGDIMKQSSNHKQKNNHLLFGCLILTGLLLSLCLFSQKSYAQCFSYPKDIGGSSSNFDDFPSIAADDHGKAMAVWCSTNPAQGTGSDYDIWVSYSTDYGRTWSAPEYLNTNAASDSGDDRYPKVIADISNDNWVVTWQSTESNIKTWEGASPIGTDADIIFSRRSSIPSGWHHALPWTEPRCVYDLAHSETLVDLWPCIATDNKGRWVILWYSQFYYEDSRAGYDYEIISVTGTNAGLYWSGAAMVNEALTDNGQDNYPSLATDGNGNWVAVWSSSQSTVGGKNIGRDYDILSAHSSNNGYSWSSPTVVNYYHYCDNTDTGTDAYPSITTDRNGTWIVVWQSNQSSVYELPYFISDLGDDDDIFLATSTNNGGTWGRSKCINDCVSDSGDDYSPQIVVDSTSPGTKGMIVWYSTENKNNIDTDWDILAAQNSSGNWGSWSNPFVLIPAYATQYYYYSSDKHVQVAMTGNGNWCAVWGSNADVGGIGYDYDILTSTTIQPSVASFSRTASKTTNAGTVDFSITFDTDVTGIDTTDFAVESGSGYANGSISSVVKVSNSQYTIKVNTGTTNGKIDIKLVDNDSIVNLCGTLLGSPLDGWGTGEIFKPSDYYIVDKTPPSAGTVTSPSGPYTFDNKQIIFNWSNFSEDSPLEVGITHYEVALGIKGDPQAYQAFTSVGLATTKTITPSILPGSEAEFPNDSKYLCTVRAVNSLGLKSENRSYMVIVDSTSLKIGEEIPYPPGKGWDNINWDATTYTTTHVIKMDHVKKLLAGDYGTFSISWVYNIEGGGLTRSYQVSSEPIKDQMVIYSTRNADGTSTRMPEVDLAGITKVTIHYNSRIPEIIFDPMDPPDERILWIDGSDKLQARSSALQLTNPEDPAFIVLQYDNDINPDPNDYIGIEVVEVKTHEQPDVPRGDIHIGSHLLPVKAVKRPADPIVTEGATSSEGGIYIYKHMVMYSSQKADQYGQLWAVRENLEQFKMEVVWRRKGLGDIAWPYELRQYTAAWPENDPDKCQRYVRGEDPLGPAVQIPADLNPVLFHQKFDTSGHYAHLDVTSFSADGPGWALLQYQTGPPEAAGLDWVGFEVIHCVSRTDPNIFNLTPVPWEIGTEIWDEYHKGKRPENPGHIYVKKDDIAMDNPQYAGDKYAPVIYGETGQIFAVNEDILEIWWFNLSRTEDPEGLAYPSWPSEEARRILWPSKVVRYSAAWPASPEKIVLARQNGSGPINEAIYGSDWEIYVRNDPEKPGFNPNDEHAKTFDYAGMRIFALRNDLGTPETSKPYVLMKYYKEQNEDKWWRFRIFKVIAQDGKYVFSDWPDFSHDADHDPVDDPYERVAGKALLAPEPLYTMSGDPGWEDAWVSGTAAWKDRKGNYWAKRAGNDGLSTDEITMQYYYKNEPDYYYIPANYTSSTFPDSDGALLLWKCKMSEGQAAVPINITYTVSWPASVPEVRMGETLLTLEEGVMLCTCDPSPEAPEQCSVDIIYEQTEGSAMLIDPVQAREVDLAEIPEDITTDPRGAETFFTDLSMALRERVSYYEIIDPLGPNTGKLKFQGLCEDPPDGFDFTTINVLNENEYNELYHLSTYTFWKQAVIDLYDIAKTPIEITDSTGISYDKIALTTGFSRGTGYVTLATQNAGEPKCSPALPVTLYIIKIIDDIYPGELRVIYPPCPFDESLTIRHKGDFGGHPDEYSFEWWSIPDVEGAKPSLPPSPSNGWSCYVYRDEGRGMIEITIRGPGKLTLSDNWFTCNFKCENPDSPWNEEESAWTEPQLAEGWIKRVLAGVGPFKQRADGSSGELESAEKKFYSYKNTNVNTVVSMISQAGPRWTGDIPLNCTGIDGLGLIEIYETVFNRGADFSINANVGDYEPVNTALLLVTSRIADLYMLLGNEAYSDACDPTIAFGTEDGTYGAEASSIHCFMNMTSSLIEEELALLRGRDDSKEPGVDSYPCYNRLKWNFTTNEGEVAYALNYDIRDQNTGEIDGILNLADAQRLYPQGHGDAWGHYLTAIKAYYRLLTHPSYTWSTRSESIMLGSEAVSVDYLDERKFAIAAAAKARTGGEIVNMTYRSSYVEDPDGQWQGYKDSDSERAWGLSEWGVRAGLGAYIDWVVGNAILKDEDTDPNHTGIQKIDRTTVFEIREIASRFQEIQAQLDVADVGLNPLGLAKNVVPFDINPDEIDRGKTHFEQIYERAVVAMNNAIAVFNHANNCTQLLRRQADSEEKFNHTVQERMADFNNRLIEIYGRPYPEDVGDGKLYEKGYEGPDLYKYDYIDPPEMTGVKLLSTQDTEENKITLKIGTYEIENFDVVRKEKEITYYRSADEDNLGFIKPPEYTSDRPASGEIQLARSELLQARIRFEKVAKDYDNLLAQIEDRAALLEEQYRLSKNEIWILNAQKRRLGTLQKSIYDSRAQQLKYQKDARKWTLWGNALAEAYPKVSGTSFDCTSAGRSAIRICFLKKAENKTERANQESLVELDHSQTLQYEQAKANLQITANRIELSLQSELKQLEQLVRQEASLRHELYTMQAAINQTANRYLSAITRGERLQEEMFRFVKQTKAEVQGYRYKDMAFRIFRNDALQKYRAQFDLAARYVYLAAKAYDYETTYLSDDTKAGEQFFTDIVRTRLIGRIEGNLPHTGKGLADPLARMSQNFELIIKPSLGFNSPEKQTDRFSLRYELFNIVKGYKGDANWRETLWRHVVPNVLDLPEFQRYARPFHGASVDVEPAIVIPFRTCIEEGLNFFCGDLVAGTHAYNSSRYTTKVRSVGIWFDNYDGAGLSLTPKAYLIPVGIDIQRSPNGLHGEIRKFMVLDQKLPVPFPIGAGNLNNTGWIPSINTLDSSFVDIRRYSSFRAYHDSGVLKEDEMHRDSSLIGRSVWNTRWLLIIPAGSLLGDRQEGLARFIDGTLKDGKREGNGIADIRIFFETYSISGG